MTEQTQQAIEAPEMDTQIEAVEQEQEISDAVDESQTSHEDVNDGEREGEGDSDVEFPKKAVNALNRKNKQITKLRAQMRELEAKLNETPQDQGKSEINPDDFENYGDYINAQVEALVEQRMSQSQSNMQKQQLAQQQEALKAQRDQYIIEQANEITQTLTDLPQVWQQNAQTLDALPEQITDIFYSIDNAPAAVYVLAKEGKLESLMYANPSVAAYEIVNAQNKGMELLSKPQTRVSQAPQPMQASRGQVKTNKNLMEGSVLKNLGLKS